MNKVGPDTYFSTEDDVSESNPQSIIVPKFRRESSYLSSEFNPSTNGSMKVMNSNGGLNDNLYLHPEVHDPRTQTNMSDHSKFSRSPNFNVKRRSGNPVLGQVAMDFGTDDIITDSIASTRLWQIFRTLLITMSILGLYHPSREDVKERDAACYGKVSMRVLLIFWGLAIGIFIFFVIILIACYTDVSNGLTILTITELCVLLCLINALIQLILFFITFDSTDRYEEMLQSWCIWLRWQNERRGPYLSSWITIITLFAVAYALTISILVGLSTFGHLRSFGLDVVPFTLQSTFSDNPSLYEGFRVCFVMAFTFATFIASLHVAFIASVCRMISYELRMLAREVQVEVRGHVVIWDMKLEPLSGQEVTVMEYLRRKHSKLCNVVSVLDSSIRESIFFSYALNLPITIINLYVLFLRSSDDDFFLGGTLVLSTVHSALQMAIIWLSAIEVHVWAHKPGRILQAIDIHEKKYITHAHQTSLFLFMTSLKARTIGLTLWGMLPLTRKFCLGVILIIVTFLIILTAHALRPLQLLPRNLTSLHYHSTTLSTPPTIDMAPLNVEATSPLITAASETREEYSGPFASANWPSDFTIPLILDSGNSSNDFDPIVQRMLILSSTSLLQNITAENVTVSLPPI